MFWQSNFWQAGFWSDNFWYGMASTLVTPPERTIRDQPQIRVIWDE